MFIGFTCAATRRISGKNGRVPGTASALAAVLGVTCWCKHWYRCTWGPGCGWGRTGVHAGVGLGGIQGRGAYVVCHAGLWEGDSVGSADGVGGRLVCGCWWGRGSGVGGWSLAPMWVPVWATLGMLLYTWVVYDQCTFP